MRIFEGVKSRLAVLIEETFVVQLLGSLVDFIPTNFKRGFDCLGSNGLDGRHLCNWLLDRYATVTLHNESSCIYGQLEFFRAMLVYIIAVNAITFGLGHCQRQRKLFRLTLQEDISIEVFASDFLNTV